MFAKYIFVLSLVSLLASLKAETFEECENVEAGTYVSWPESCSAFIYCNGDDSTRDECDEGQYFDFEGQKCDDKENVECPLDNIEEETNEEAGNEDTDENEGETEGEGDSDGDYDEDEESTEAPGSDESTLTTLTPTIETTTNATMTNVTMPSVDIPPVVQATCPQTDDPNQIVFIASNLSCNDYYVCYHGRANAMHCMDHLHFNLVTGKCDFPENANCKLAIQTPSSSEFNKCLPHMKEFFPHPTKCNYFYYCIKGYQTLQQCPFYYGWDIQKRTCVHMAHAKCYNDAT